MTVWPMRPSLANRLVRTPTRNAAAAAVTVTAAPPVAALCHSKHDNFSVANTPIHSKSFLGNVWFSSSAPYSLPDSALEGDHKPPDERTLKLGKSMCFLGCRFLSRPPANRLLRQLFAYSTNAFLACSRRPCHKRYSHLKYHFIYSPRHIRIFRLSLEGSPTSLLCGQHL